MDVKTGMAWLFAGAAVLAALVFFRPSAGPPAPHGHAKRLAAEPPPDGEGFVPLFDGTSTAAWRGFRDSPFPERSWKVEDGLLTSTAEHPLREPADLVTWDEFADFELEVEWRVEHGANSGIFYLIDESAPGAAIYDVSLEYQLRDDDYWNAQGKIAPESRTASIEHTAAPSAGPPCVPGVFNTSRIVKKGTRVEHWLNGALVLSLDLAAPSSVVAADKREFLGRFATRARGRIGIQDYGTAVSFRRIRIRPLPAPDAGAPR